MEDIIAIYELPYDEDYPVVCMDETCKQLIGDVHEAIPCAPGRPARMDHEYVRNGVAEVFLEVEPLTGKRHVAATEHRARKDWAWWIKGMLDARYPNAVQVRLVLDNLNTHCPASLYETFEPQEARRLAERLEIHYTPKHGSWLNMAEIELSALNGQCLDRRIPDLRTCKAISLRGRMTGITGRLKSTGTFLPTTRVLNSNIFIRSYKGYWVLGVLPVFRSARTGMIYSLARQVGQSRRAKISIALYS